jgi:indolepyruvate ferredoxin oxidoreductase beta subunit
MARKKGKLEKDPLNIIISGVGGQGNIMASLLLGKLLVRHGYRVVIGETYGATQRGGSVMSHIRVSEGGEISPLIPRGKAHCIVALEPAEALRVMGDYGNPDVRVLSNTRPVYPVDVITGALEYPKVDELKTIIKKHTKEAIFVDATDIALKIKDPILSNIIMLGAFARWGVLPLSLSDFEEAIRENIHEKHQKINIDAFNEGAKAFSAP